MTTRTLTLIVLGWLVIAVGISTGVMAAVAPLRNRLDPCITYYQAHPNGWCEGPLVIMFDAFIGVGTLLILVAPLIWLLMRYGPKEPA